jgi:hypothetical protein
MKKTQDGSNEKQRDNSNEVSDADLAHVHGGGMWSQLKEVIAHVNKTIEGLRS